MNFVKLIPALIVFCILTVVYYSPENVLIERSQADGKLEPCESVKRDYFKRTCLQSYQKILDARCSGNVECRDEMFLVNRLLAQTSLGYFFVGIELILVFMISLVMTGRAYPQALESYVAHPTWGRWVFRYRQFQHDVMFFLPRLAVAGSLFAGLMALMNYKIL